MTAFFIPGITGDLHVVENAYAKLRLQTEQEMGRPPSSRRILSLWTRRGSTDCVTEVGVSDPLRGGTVIAIFDMGRHSPFVVWWQENDEALGAGRDVLGPESYAVSEFDA